uniref:HDC10383 n=1 Tax=Drosophila melanogaster TaxID=7227 RepID=Q6IL48_DROME|nr:TPA_inf: HDC10383 [Drosophila melanogaster]
MADASAHWRIEFHFRFVIIATSCEILEDSIVAMMPRSLSAAVALITISGSPSPLPLPSAPPDKVLRLSPSLVPGCPTMYLRSKLALRNAKFCACVAVAAAAAAADVAAAPTVALVTSENLCWRRALMFGMACAPMQRFSLCCFADFVYVFVAGQQQHHRHATAICRQVDRSSSSSSKNLRSVQHWSVRSERVPPESGCPMAKCGNHFSHLWRPMELNAY